MKTRISILATIMALVLVFYACTKENIYEAETDNILVENLTITGTGVNSVRMDWQFDEDLSCTFRIDKKTNDENWIDNYAILDGEIRNWTDDQVELDQELVYRFYTVYENELSEKKIISRNNKMDPPSDLTSIVLGESSIQLNWTDNAFEEAGTMIERDLATDTLSLWKEIFTTPENITSWTDTRLSPNMLYSYRVRAYFTTHTSDYSNESQNSTLANGFIYVPPGNFAMGNDYDDEQPIHNVTISSGYLIGKYEVTQKEWNDLMSVHTAHISYPIGYGEFGSGDNYPIYGISWYSALVYCNERSVLEGLTPCYSIKGSSDLSTWGPIPIEYDADWEDVVFDTNANGYRLPTEAEWEYAARYDDNRIYPWGNDIPAPTLSNFNGNVGLTTEVGSYPLGNSKLGICDMGGNVWEMCWDKADVYSADSVTDPTGSPEPSPFTYDSRILRGGDWYHSHDNTTLRSSYRNISNSSIQFGGFRIVKLP